MMVLVSHAAQSLFRESQDCEPLKARWARLTDIGLTSIGRAGAETDKEIYLVIIREFLKNANLFGSRSPLQTTPVRDNVLRAITTGDVPRSCSRA
jgi:hypothetical protein